MFYCTSMQLYKLLNSEDFKGIFIISLIFFLLWTEHSYSTVHLKYFQIYFVGNLNLILTNFNYKISNALKCLLLLLLHK